jgi:para-nitrobenzyl esterase
VGQHLARPFDFGPAFQLVADGDLVAADPLAALPGSMSRPVLLCGTAHEVDAFCVPDPRIQAMSKEDTLAALRPLLGPDTETLYDAADPDALPARIGADLATYHYFHRDLERLRPCPRYAPVRLVFHRQPSAGLPLYRSAVHIRQPDGWRHAPMLHAASNDQIDRLTHTTQLMVADFAHGLSPS